MSAEMTNASDIRREGHDRKHHTHAQNTCSATNTATAIREEADGLVVHGEPFARVVALADRLHAAHDLPCLIEGETGSGKEYFAKALHAASERRARPFIAVNCAAIPEAHIEAELFGVRHGALAGGPCEQRGTLERADGGTLLLEEAETGLDVLTQGVADIEVLTGDFNLHGRRKYPCFALLLHMGVFA